LSLGYSATVGSASTCKPQNLLGDISGCTEGLCAQPYGTTLGAETGIGGVWQLPAANPSYPDIQPPQVRTRVSGFKERSGALAGRGGSNTRRMDGNGQQQKPPSLDFWALFIKKKCLARPAKEGKKSLPGEGKKKAPPA